MSANPGITSRYLKNGAQGQKLLYTLIGNEAVYRMVPLSMTSSDLTGFSRSRYFSTFSETTLDAIVN